MQLRLVTASVLLLGTAALAQLPVPAPGQAPAPTAPAPAAQDPDKPKPTPADQVKELTTERDRLAREIAYVQERARNAKALLAQKLGGKPPTWKAIDAGTNTPAVQPFVPPAPPRQARLATPEELGNHANDTLLIVNGRAIPQKAFDDLMLHLAANPAAGDEAARAQRALLDLIRIEAIASAFEDNEAAERTGEILGQLDAGKPIGELAPAVGVVPGASLDGKVEVTRNSVFGPRFEQVAFATEAGKRARPFRNNHGLVILQVDKVEKGATPEQDKVVGTAIQVPYSPDQQALQKAHLAVNTGQVDVFARDQKALDMLPEFFRRPAPAAVPAPLPAARIDAAALTRRLEQMAVEMAALEGKTDDGSKARLQAMQREYAQLKGQMRMAEAGEAPDEVQVDAAAVQAQLEQVAKEMAALQGKTDDASKAKLEALNRQYAALKNQLRGGGQAPVEIKDAPKPPVKKN